MAKFYRVKQDTFIWKEGAILELDSDDYVAIEDIWDVSPRSNGSYEYISADIIEHPNNATYFERVYPDTLKGNVYRTADQMREMYKKSFK